MNSQLTCMSSCEQPLVGDGGKKFRYYEEEKVKTQTISEDRFTLHKHKPKVIYYSYNYAMSPVSKYNL